MTHEEIAKQILSLEQNPSYHPGAKGEREKGGKEFKEEDGGGEEKSSKRKHVGRGGKY